MELYKKLTTIVLGTLCVLSTIAYAADTSSPTDPGKWNMTLAGSGASTINRTVNSFGANIGLSYDTKFVLTMPLNLGFRQGVSYASTGNSLNGDTELFADYRLMLTKKFGVFVGPSGKAQYGNIAPNWSLGPEFGGLFYFKPDVFTFGRVNYDFKVNNRVGSDADGMRYSLGIGFNW